MREKESFRMIFIDFLVPEINDDFEDWINFMRERRAGRPQYGLLG